MFEIQARAAGPSASCENARSADEQLVFITYLNDIIELYQNCHYLKSTKSINLLRQPRSRLRQYSDRTFSYTAPRKD